MAARSSVGRRIGLVLAGLAASLVATGPAQRATAAPTVRQMLCTGSAAMTAFGDPAYFAYPTGIQAHEILKGTGPYFPNQLILTSITYDATASTPVDAGGVITYTTSVTISPQGMANAANAAAGFGTPNPGAYQAQLQLGSIAFAFPAPISLPSNTTAVPIGTPTATSPGRTVAASFAGSQLMVNLSDTITATSGGSAAPITITIGSSYTLTGAQPGDTVALRHAVAAATMSANLTVTYAGGVNPGETSAGTGTIGCAEPTNPTSPLVTAPVVAPTASIAGTVTAASGGAPLDGIRVGLYPAAGVGRLATAVTAGGGGYAFAGLPSGSYRLKAWDPAGTFLTEWHADAATWAAGTDVVLPAAGAADVDFALGGGAASVSGEVRDETNGDAPIPGATVNVYGVGGGLITSAVTSAGGTFAVAGLPPGDILLKISHPQYFTEWYQDAWRSTHGQALTVLPGSSSSLSGAAAIRLTAQAAPTVEGTVTDASTAAPLAGAAVVLYTASGQVASFTTDANGHYALGGLTAATPYFVRFSTAGYAPEWYQEAGPSFSGATALVYDGATPFSGVDGSLAPAG